MNFKTYKDLTFSNFQAASLCLQAPRLILQPPNSGRDDKHVASTQLLSLTGNTSDLVTLTRKWLSKARLHHIHGSHHSLMSISTRMSLPCLCVYNMMPFLNVELIFLLHPSHPDLSTKYFDWNQSTLSMHVLNIDILFESSQMLIHVMPYFLSSFYLFWKHSKWHHYFILRKSL